MLLSADFPFRINVNIIYSNYSLNAAQLNKCLVTIFTGTVIKKSANSLQHCNVSYHNGCSTHTQTGANSLQQGENVTGCLTQIRVKYPTWGKFITAWEKCHITLAFRSRWGRNTPTHCHVTLEILQLGQTLTLVQECLWGQFCLWKKSWWHFRQGYGLHWTRLLESERGSMKCHLTFISQAWLAPVLATHQLTSTTPASCLTLG